MWFVGLYETLLGNEDLLFQALAKWCAPAFLLPLSGFFLISAIGYVKYLRKMRETRKRTKHLYRLRERFADIFNRVLLKNPIQRAVFYFFWNTLKKSNLHRMRLASYMMVAGGIVFILLVSRSNPLESFDTFDKTVLSIPFIFTFFIVMGIRATSQIPITIEANWIFRLGETTDKKQYFIGFKKAIIFFIIIPLFLLLTIFYLWLWGWIYTLFFCTYGIVTSILLVEAVFVNHHKIPFTCSYLPGKGKLHVFWAIYLILLVLYVSFSAFIAYGLLLNPSNFAYFYAIALVLFVALQIIHSRLMHSKGEIIYEEEREPVLLTLVPEE
jgi:hypothetical protein